MTIRFFPGHICVSYLIYHLICFLFLAPPTIFQTIIMIIFGVLPDFDQLYLPIYFRFKKDIPPEKKTQHHSFAGHYPLIYAPIAISFLLPFAFPSWFPFHFIFAINLALLIHFILDTICVSDGIRWFWPKSCRQVRFLTPQNLRDQHGLYYMKEYRKTYIFKIEIILLILSGFLIVVNDFLYYNYFFIPFLIILVIVIISILLVFFLIIEPYGIAKRISTS